MNIEKEKLIRGMLNSLLPVFLSFSIGAVVILMINENPLETYSILIQKSLLTRTGFMNTLHYAAPLILTGLAIAVTFKAGVYNMGVEGQMLMGGFFAGLFGAYLTGMNPILHKSICILVGILVGMLFALIPAILKVKFKANEMVVTLMLNYALIKLLEFLATGVFRDLESGYVATPIIKDSAMFLRFGVSRLTMFFFISMIVLILMQIVMKKSSLGYEITAIGKNFEFSESMGMKNNNKIIKIMLISGALSGLAGAGYMMSDQFKFTLGFSGIPGLGWDGMLIALLGSNSPVGIFIAAIFYASLKTGSDNINIYTSVPKEIVAMIQGLIILFLAIKFINEKTNVIAKLRSKTKEVIK